MIDYWTMPATGVDLVDPIHKAQYIVMSSTYPLPFKFGNQVIWQNHTLKFYTMHPCTLILPFHLKQVYKYEQLFYQESQINYLKVHLFQLLHLHISVNMAVV